MGGRPPEVTPEITEIICSHIASGKPLQPLINSSDTLPHYSSIMNWVVWGDAGKEPYVEFAARYHSAREAGGHAYADKIVELSETVMQEGVNSNSVNVAMKGLMWSAGVFNNWYAPKVQGNGKGGSIVINLSQGDADLL